MSRPSLKLFHGCRLLRGDGWNPYWALLLCGSGLCRLLVLSSGHFSANPFSFLEHLKAEPFPLWPCFVLFRSTKCCHRVCVCFLSVSLTRLRESGHHHQLSHQCMWSLSCYMVGSGHPFVEKLHSLFLSLDRFDNLKYWNLYQKGNLI
jgi:hypothetical protein